jgi:hypothetical protein
VDHAALIADLEATSDGWALSSGADLDAMRYVIPLLPDGVRVCPWVKPFASFKPNVTLAYAWEPIYIKPARRRGRDLPTVRDWIAAGYPQQVARRRARPRLRDWVSANITLRRGLSGAKPEAVCWWLFDALGAEPGDTFVDLFPGTGGVGRAWDEWSRSPLRRIA